MQIIIQKSDKYILRDFFNTIIHLDYIDGICLNVGLTKDDKLVVFNTTVVDNLFVKTVYANTYQDLQSFDLVLLQDIMNYLNQIHYSKKIFLNLIPLQPKELTEEVNEQLFHQFQLYALKLSNLLQDKKLNIYIHSIARPLIKIVKDSGIKAKFGFAIVGFDLNYIDLDYYIFTMQMINFDLLAGQIDKDKIVMIYSSTEEDLSYLYNILLGNRKNSLSNKIYENSYIISAYPELVNKTFSTK